MIDALLSRLHKVRQTGRDSWVACCPAHDDRRPSLAITTDSADGRILLHCFGGCSADEVVTAAGMSIEDLFPPRLGHSQPPTPARERFPARDVLECVAKEVMIAMIYASDMARGKPLSEPDRLRLNLSATRLQEAINVLRD